MAFDALISQSFALSRSPVVLGLGHGLQMLRVDAGAHGTQVVDV
jgi:hypothetical protein